MRYPVSILALGVLVLSGCDTMDKVEDKATELLVQGADRYCAKSDAGKAAAREMLDAALAPRKLRLEGC